MSKNRKDQYTIKHFQGDILIRPLPDFDMGVLNSGKEIPRENNRIVLAYGEKTGHAHVIETEGVTMIEGTFSRRLLHALNEFVVQHNTHDPHTLPAGVYEVVRQRQYFPAANRWVDD